MKKYKQLNFEERVTNKVMIIDDNGTNVKLMELVLQKAGFKTDAILNPKYVLL